MHREADGRGPCDGDWANMKENKQSSAPLRGAPGIDGLAFFALAYFLCAEIGRFLVLQFHPAAMFWLPSGLFLGVLLLHEARAWPAFLLAGGVANVGFHLCHGDAVLPSLLFFCGGCAEALAGAWLVRRFVARRPNLATLKQMVGFAFFAAILSPVLSASVGTAVLHGLRGATALGKLWLLWWSSGAIGILLVGSLILIWPANGWFIKQMSRWRRVELCAVVLVVVAGCWFVFGATDRGTCVRPFLLIPCLIWAGLRFGLRAAVLASMSFSFSAVWYTSRGMGALPLLAQNSLDQALILHLYAVTVSLSCLLPASIMAERRDVEARLRQSDATARSLLEAPGALAFMIDPEGIILDANHQLSVYLGKPALALAGTSVWDYLSPGKENSCRAIFRKVLEERKPLRHETEALGGWHDCSVYPVLNERGEVEKVAVMAWDITERKRAEQALYQSEQRYRLLIETMNEGVARVNAFGIIEYVNKKFCEMTGSAAADLVGSKHTEVIAEEFRERHDANFQQRRLGVFSNYETVLQRKDGTRRVCILSGSPLFGQDGSFSGALGIFTDITENKRAEDECRHLARELGQKNLELENVLYAASHDLRSPVVNIQGFSKRVALACAEITTVLAESELAPALRERLARITGEEIPKSLRFIQSSVIKMDALISGLLRLSRVGQVTLRRETLDMNLTISQIVSTMAFQIQKSGAAIQVEALPSVAGDSMLLNQVFSNLLDNALKYRSAERPLRLRVAGRLDNGECLYCIEDNGLGIAADRQKKIWELFYRLNPNGPVAGEGLGLNLVHRIVERHNGRVWVESTLGEGSRFFVALPAGSVHPAAQGGTL